LKERGGKRLRSKKEAQMKRAMTSRALLAFKGRKDAYMSRRDDQKNSETRRKLSSGAPRNKWQGRCNMREEETEE